MAAQGTTTVDFGAFPGDTYVTVAVTGQTGILAGSLVEAWIIPATTADHSVDEHVVDAPVIRAGNVVAGTGFTIYASAPRDGEGQYWGQWNVGWVWN